MEQQIFQKEYSIREILFESWRLFKENFQLVLIVTLIVYIPINIILSFIPTETLFEQNGLLQGFTDYIRIVQILEELIGIIATMAIAFIIKSKLDGNIINYKMALKKSFSRWAPAIWTNILLGLLLLGLFLLLIIPGIIYAVYWMFTLYAVVLYDKSGKDALNYSKNVVKGRWWKVFCYSLVFGILSLVVGIATGIPSWFLPESFFLTIISDVFIDVVASFFTVVFAVFFINLDSTKTAKVQAGV